MNTTRDIINMGICLRFISICVINFIPIKTFWKIFFLIFIFDIFDNFIFYILNFFKKETLKMTKDDYIYYQKWDKFLDTLSNSVILFYLSQYNDKLFFNIFAFLYIYRIVGIVYYYKTNDLKYLVRFPNYFDFMAVVYSLLQDYFPKTDQYIKLILIFGTIPLKLYQENYLYNTHMKFTQ